MPIPTSSTPISSVFLSPPRLLTGHQGAIYDALYDSAGARWITAGGDGIVAAWSNGSKGAPHSAPPSDGTALAQHGTAFYALHNPDGDENTGPDAGLRAGRLLAGTADGHIIEFPSDGKAKEIRRIESHRGGVFCFANFEGSVWSGGADGTVVRWSADGCWDVAKRLELGSGKIRVLCRTPMGLYVGTGSGRGFMISNGTTKVTEFGKAAAGIYCAAWLNEKRTLLLGDRDGVVRAVDRHGIGVTEFQAHLSSIYRLVIGGDWIFTGSRDKSVKAWNANSLEAEGRVGAQAGGPSRSVNALAWDGCENVLSGGDDRIARIWGVRGVSEIDVG